MNVDIKNVGKYKALLVNGYLWMMNDENEFLYIEEAVSKCKGNILIAGYGLGLLYERLKDYPNKIDIVEISKDVVDKVGINLRLGDNLIIGDFLKYKFDKKYDTVLVDIWLDWSKETYEKIYKPAIRKAREILNSDGMIWAWGEQEMQRLHGNK